MGGESTEIVGKNRDHLIADAVINMTDASGPIPAPLITSSATDDESTKIATTGHAEDRHPEPESDSAWRDELSARLTRYRARRKLPPPRYPSLSLKFDPAEAARKADTPHASLVSFEPLYDQALALDGMASASPEVSAENFHNPVSASAQPLLNDPAIYAAHAAISPAILSGSRPATHSIAHGSAKIIEFPRFAWAPPPPPPDQLAEPVSTRPRILEVPEFAPPPPALGGITIEPAEREDDDKRPGVDFPLQAVSLTRRIFAAAVDGVIIATAAAVFGAIFWKITDINPPLLQTMELAAAIPCLFWAVYQYLLIVYSGSTPGLRAAGLELARFDGSPTTRSLRRWRVVASYLSAASLGMGYVWVFLDEDSLCWHDRATRTHLAPKAVAK
jgi:uncharacterized RDD family membrane protein YckC